MNFVSQTPQTRDACALQMRAHTIIIVKGYGVFASKIGMIYAYDKCMSATQQRKVSYESVDMACDASDCVWWPCMARPALSGEVDPNVLQVRLPQAIDRKAMAFNTVDTCGCSDVLSSGRTLTPRGSATVIRALDALDSMET